MKLKHIQMLSLAFLTTLSLSANEQQDKQIYLSAAEVQEIFENPTRAYVYVGRDVTNLADIIDEISKLENDEDTPVKALKNHIEQGYVIGNYDGVAIALEHAEEVVNKIDPDKETELAQSLNTIVEQVAAEKLNLDAAMLSAANVQAPETKSCGSCTSHCLRMLVIKEKIDFLNKIKFREDVTFYDDVRFRDDVRIDGSLSVSDQTIGCDLTVGCNISINDTVSTDIGNIVQGGDRVLHNFGINNIFVGRNAGNYTVTGMNNAAFGVGALTADSAGSFNTALGTSALAANTTGIQNTAAGAGALAANQIGQANTAVGTNALASSTADNNTALGASALFNTSTGTGNIGIGVTAGSTLITGSGNIYIGADAAAAAEATTTRIGTAQTACYIQGIYGQTYGATNAPVIVDNTGKLGTMASTKRVKHNIQDMNEDSAAIYNLRPVTFAYNHDVSETKQYGLIAEETETVFPGIVVKDEDGQPATVQYHILPALLLNELQKLAARVTALEARS